MILSASLRKQRISLLKSPKKRLKHPMLKVFKLGKRKTSQLRLQLRH
jgi:hypothetical protein